MANTTKGSLANAGAYSQHVQDSFMLNEEGKILLLLVKSYQDAVKRGDPTEIVSVIRGLEAHIRLAASWTRSLAPEIVNSLPMLSREEEHEMARDLTNGG